MSEFFSNLLDSEYIIKNGGLAVITFIVFCETGFFFAFFLPGDYLLFSAGIFCGTGHLPVSVFLLASCLFVAAVSGNITGFYIGKFLGHKMVDWNDSLFWKRKYIDNTHKVFEKYGGMALVVGRFLPIVRTMGPVLAGIAKMRIYTFLMYNILGGAIWVSVLVFSGFYLGQRFHTTILDYLPYIIVAFFCLTSIMVISSYLKVRAEARKELRKAEEKAN